MLSCQINISKENDSTPETPHYLEDFRNKVVQPKLLKEIREKKFSLKCSAIKLEDSNPIDSNLISSSESDMKSSELKIPIIINETDFVEEKEGSKSLYNKKSEGFHKRDQIKKQSTHIQKKMEKNKMHNFVNLISNIFVIKEFINKLRNLSFLRSPAKLKTAQFNLIGDKSYIKEENSHYASLFGEKFFIFDPSKDLSIFMDFLILLALSYFFLMIPLHFTYKFLAVNSVKKDLDLIAFCILVFDIFRTFNTAIYERGRLVYSRWKIAVHYLEQDLPLDLISLTPVFILVMNTYQDNDQYFIILFYLKIKNLKKMIRKLEQLLLSNRKFQHELSLIKLIVWIIFITHSFACLWNGIGLVGDKYFEKTWLKENRLESSDSIEQYLYSYYFVCVTMNTVGFGDISPTNKLEVLFCILFIFLACGIFAYSINSIGIILNDISKQHDEYRKDLNTINDYMKKKKISFDLRMRIRKYLEYIKKEKEKHEDQETEKTIDKLSDSLREELLLEANGSILKRIKFFSFNFSEETLRKTMMKLKEVRFTPGDIIFERGDLQENKLYIIKTGEVELLFGNSSHLQTVHICKKGDTFGEFAFFSGQEQKFSARSLDFTTAFAIDRSEFISIIGKVNKDFEKFNELKENLVLYHDPSPLHSGCFCCHHTGHRLEKCPIIHYCPKNEIIIHKFLFNDQSQKRGHYQRTRKFKINNSFINKFRNRNKAQLLQEDLKKTGSYLDIEGESEEEEEQKETAFDLNDSISRFEKNISSFESLDSQAKKPAISNRSKIINKIKEFTKDDSQNEETSLKLAFANNNEKTMENQLNLISWKEKIPQIYFFDMIDFDKIGFFSNYFPKNDVELILKTIELKRVNFLKRICSRRYTSFFHSSPKTKNFATIHRIDEAFIEGGNIKINQKTIVNFNEDRQKKERSRTLAKQVNLKKNFFQRIEESPEEIHKYFRAKLSSYLWKKKFKIALKKIRYFFKKPFFKKLV